MVLVAKVPFGVYWQTAQKVHLRGQGLPFDGPRVVVVGGGGLRLPAPLRVRQPARGGRGSDGRQGQERGEEFHLSRLLCNAA